MKKLTVKEMKELLKDTKVQPSTNYSGINMTNSKYVSATGSYFGWTSYNLL